MSQTRGAAAWHSFVRSNWITAVWNWLLGLVGKAAEAVLAVTILYSTVQVFTTTNPSIDLAMFLAQQAALDVGGLGLIKLANQAKRDGLVEQSARARTVSIILMVLMVIGVVVANVESKITTTQTTLDAHHHLVTTMLGFQQAYPIAAIVIEVILLIARGTMAVVYGFTIHDLESSMPEQKPAQDQQDIQALISWPMVAMAAQLQQEYHQIARDQANHIANLERRLADMHQEPQPTTDFEALTEAVTRNLAATFEARFEAMVRQYVTISEAKGQHEARCIEAPKRPHEATTRGPRPATNIVTLRQPGTSATDKRAAVYALLEKGDQRSSYQLAPEIGCSAATIQRYMKDWREARGEAEQPAI